MTISTELATFDTAVENIRTEISNKGQSSSGTIISLSTRIDNISNKNGENFSKDVLKDVVEGTIENLYDKELLYIRPYCFTGCEKLNQAWFTSLKKICRHAFDGCYQLRTLILTSTDMVFLENVNSFKHTLIDKGIGKIYVTNSLVSKYKAQTLDDGTSNNWYSYRNFIESINNYSE